MQVFHAREGQACVVVIRLPIREPIMVMQAAVGSKRKDAIEPPIRVDIEAVCFSIGGLDLISFSFFFKYPVKVIGYQSRRVREMEVTANMKRTYRKTA